MAFKSPDNTPEFRKELLALTDVECCALWFAFENNPRAVQELVGMHGADKLERVGNELSHTTRLEFYPQEADKMIYAQLIAAELKRLDTAGADFECDHSAREHQEALESVRTRTKPMIQ